MSYRDVGEKIFFFGAIIFQSRRDNKKMTTMQVNGQGRRDSYPAPLPHDFPFGEFRFNIWTEDEYVN